MNQDKEVAAMNKLYEMNNSAYAAISNYQDLALLLKIKDPTLVVR